MDDPVAGATTDAVPPSVLAPAFAPGALIAGRYRLESRLGAGGGGTVWRCTDDKLAMTVALKIVGSDGELERWRREVAMARRIADRNVCRVHDLGEADGVRFVTMEIVDGVGLRAKLANGIPHEQARDLFAQVVSGVAAIHAAGVVHRDMKPDNVVVATDGRAVIVDFGLAREPRAPHDPPANGGATTAPASANLTRDGAIVGTPRYMSPEQAAGEVVDARTDVFALGLIGYELLTGALPKYDADGKSRIIDPAALSAWPAIVPVLRTCLALDPADRYQDARALRDAITPRPRRRGLYVAAAAIALGAVAGGAVLLAGRTNEAERVAAVEDARAADASPPPPTGPVTPVRLVSPAESIAISPDAKEYAYTIEGGKLFVAPLAGGPPREWKLPVLELRAGNAPPRKSSLITTWACGWFTDGSLGVIGLADTGVWHLVRVHEDGRHSVLFSTTDRFTATARGDIAAIGVHETAIFVVNADKPEALDEVVSIGSGETVMALAISPDAKRIAAARLPRGSGKKEAVIQVLTLTGDSKEIWTGVVDNDIDQTIAWLDDDRVAFVHRTTKPSKLFTHDLRTGQTRQRYEWKQGEYAGIGSGARGELLIVGGRLAFGVGIGGPRAERLEPVHDPAGYASWPAGWTPDGQLVFQLRDARGVDRIVRKAPGGDVLQWPGLDGGETPNTMAGDSLIVHRTDAATTENVIERVSPTGRRKELHRVPAVDARYHVRCAGDRDKPCFIEETSAREIAWRLFYPFSGEVGRVLHKRLRRQPNMQTAALSADGKTLAIVEGTSELLLVDVENNSVRTIDAGTGVELQTTGFAGDGTLWATAVGYRGHFFALLRFTARDGRIANQPSDVLHGQNRFFWRPTPSPDGKHLGLRIIDFYLEAWRLPGV